MALSQTVKAAFFNIFFFLEVTLANFQIWAGPRSLSRGYTIMVVAQKEKEDPAFHQTSSRVGCALDFSDGGIARIALKTVAGEFSYSAICHGVHVFSNKRIIRCVTVPIVL